MQTRTVNGWIWEDPGRPNQGYGHWLSLLLIGPVLADATSLIAALIAEVQAWLSYSVWAFGTAAIGFFP